MANRRPKPVPVPAARRPRHLLFLAVLWLATLAAYSNSFGAGLVFDSQRLILADSRLQADTPDNIHQIWTGDYYNGTGSGALYRPLTTMSYFWNSITLGDGTNAGGYHAVNFAIHALNIALVYALGLILLEESWAAFALAAIWALHPVLTESVTNVAGRADLLAACGILTGLLCYAWSVRAAGWQRMAWIGGLAASATIAAFSKESGIVLPAVLIAYEVAFAPLISWRDRGIRYAAVLLPIGIFLLERRSALAQVSSLLISFCDNPLLGAGFLASRLTAIKVLGRYLGLLVWPAHLSADYSYNEIPLGGVGAILALLWIAIAAGAVVSYRRARPVFFGVLFFLVTIAPMANIFLLVGSIMAERFLYLPSIGFAICVIWFARRLPVPPKALVAALAVLCLVFAGRSYARNIDWHDERALWSSAVGISPESYKTHHNMALMILADAHPDYAAATREVERSLAILDPLPDSRNMSAVYATAGRCYRAQGDSQKALAVLLRGRAIDRAWNEAFQAVNRRDGKTVGSVGTPGLYLDLARVYLDLGQPDKAIEALKFGRTIDPEPDFFAELARAYSTMGQNDQAAISLFEGLTVTGGQPALLSNLKQLYRMTASQSCALNGNSPNMACPMVHDEVCTAARNVASLFTDLHDPASANAALQNAARNYGCR